MYTYVKWREKGRKKERAIVVTKEKEGRTEKTSMLVNWGLLMNVTSILGVILHTFHKYRENTLNSC